MQRLEVSGAVRPIYGSLGVKRLIVPKGVRTSIKINVNVLYDFGRTGSNRQYPDSECCLLSPPNILLLCYRSDTPAVAGPTPAQSYGWLPACTPHIDQWRTIYICITTCQSQLTVSPNPALWRGELPTWHDILELLGHQSKHSARLSPNLPL